MKADRLMIAAGISLAGICCSGAYGQGKIKVIKPPAQQQSSDGNKTGTAGTPAATDKPSSSEPDKVLYERALLDLKKKRYTEERLSLQILINTYPDSEYLADAKLAVADSYYQEGGVSNLTQAIAEYKSYVVFFPFLEKAAYAQMQIGMCHFKMMEKSDRDTSESLMTEAELQTFIKTYPDSKLIPGAEQRLRDVQEIIADGQYKVARFYYLRPDYRASAARLVELTERYPLYSQSDEALWMLSDIYSLMRKYSKNEDDKNHWADLQAKVLDQLVTNYPLSARASQAKTQLKAMGMDVPQANPAAVDRMQKQVAYQKAHHSNALLAGPTSLLKSTPDFSLAARSGTPNLDPPAQSVSAKDILSPTTSGPSFNLAASTLGGGGSGDVVSPDGKVIPAEPNGDSGGAVPTPQAIISAPTTSSAPADADPPAANQPAAVVGAPGGSSIPVTAADPVATTNSSAASASGSSTDAAPSQGATTDGTPSAQTGSTTAKPATQEGSAPSTDKSTTSSSKKKKGLGKIF